MTLEELLGMRSLSELSTEELHELLRQVRHNRTTQETIAQKATTKSTKKAAANFIEKLSEDEKAKLRELLLGGGVQ